MSFPLHLFFHQFPYSFLNSPAISHISNLNSEVNLDKNDKTESITIKVIRRWGKINTRKKHTSRLCSRSAYVQNYHYINGRNTCWILCYRHRPGRLVRQPSFRNALWKVAWTTKRSYRARCWSWTSTPTPPSSPSPAGTVPSSGLAIYSCTYFEEAYE